MKMTVDDAKLLHIAKAAQIRIPEDEFQAMKDRINDILDVCAVVGELDCSDVPEFAWEIRKHPKRRADEPHQWPDRDVFMASAPTREGDFFRVPRIATEE